jgi:exodeoxyribonuclease VII large subunit
VSDQPYDLFARREKRTYKVGELTRELKGLLEGRFPLVSVEGEISNFRRNATSGHCYLTLKDETSSLKCALFRGQAAKVRFPLNDGLHVLAKGRISVYEAGGEYNLVVDTLEPLGAGALALRFEELKRRLAAEGLFDPAAKRVLPMLPRRIGVVTSPTGAAVQDFLRVLHKRFPNLPVLIAPARVQGEGAAAEICRGLQRLGGVPDVDVIVVTRGGGSLEDLWAFNEEAVARAIRRSPVPVISAVGHEVDFTIADFAADVRAPTPTGAAELIVRVKDDLAENLRLSAGRLRRAMSRHLEARRHRLLAARRALSDPRRVIGERRISVDRLLQRAERSLRERLRRQRTQLDQLVARLDRTHPRARLGAVREQLGKLEARANRSMQARIGREKQAFGASVGRLDALSPLKVLSRGYALAYDDAGRLVRDVTTLSPGDAVQVRVAGGRFDAAVTATHPSAAAAPDAD